MRAFAISALSVGRARTSESGQKLTRRTRNATSASPPDNGHAATNADVRFVQKGDIARLLEMKEAAN
jgi:hypothetical protein